jgi:RNA polymerase sigma-70 factor (ECF subfamily)
MLICTGMDSFYSNKNRYLLSGLKKGNAEAFEIIYKTFHPKLVAFTFRYLKVHEDAEGLVQDVFVELWKNHSKINVNLSISSYLFTITKNKIVDYFRKKKRQNLFNDYLVNFIKNPVIQVNDSEHKESSKQINQVIKNLPEKRKTVYLLNKKFGLNRKEIAEFMNVSENTVKNHLLEAIRTLKRTLYKENVLFFFLITLFFHFN